MKCIILDDYQNVALSYGDWSKLEEVDVTVLNEFLEGNDLISRIADAEILVVMRERTPVTRDLIDQLPHLKLVITSGMRNASIDLRYAQEKGIVVCGTKGHKTPPMELTWALILGVARNISQESNAFKNQGPWQTTVGVGLKGKTLALLGLGHIGTLMVPVAKAFGMDVIAWSSNLSLEKCEELGVRYAENKEDLMQQADFLSIHLVLSERSKHTIGEKELSLMKNTAFLINTSRANIVDQDALIQALQENKIQGAGLDVFDQEPLGLDHPFRKLKNVLSTPHLGYVADLNYHHYFSEAVEDIEAFLKGSPLRALAAK